MDTNVQFKLIRALGITGLVIGVITLLISFVPCLGVFAFIPGVVGIVISFTGIMMARKQHVQKNILVAALVISLIGTATSMGWALYTNNVMNKDASEESTGKGDDDDKAGESDVKSLMNESAAKDSISREAAAKDSLNNLRQDQKTK